ncbi:MAG: SCO6880 family protein [Candidatus Nanopelagicales bacterium]
MSTPVRVYGGWRERRGFGIGSLSGRQTAFGLVAVLMVLLCLMMVPRALPLLAVPVGLALAAVFTRVRGESLVSITSRHAQWQRAKSRGRTTYNATQTPELPGVLSQVSMIAGDGYVVLYDKPRRTLTALVPVEPQGVTFATADEITDWMTRWGGWLSHLGYVPNVAHVVVTVHTAPGPADVFDDEPADGLAADVMRDLRALSVSRCVARTVLSVTVHTGGSDVPVAAQRLQEVLGSLESLNTCGVTVLDAMSDHDVTQWVRSCYDPSLDHGTYGQWLDARPTAAVEQWDNYRHDSGVSAAFMWDECPGDGVSAQSLNRLLGPADYVKRVSMVFEPISAHVAAREVDRQAEAASFRSEYRRRLGRDETARERLDIQKARQTAHEQASGSGLVDVGLYAVVTAHGEQDLESCAADLHNRAGEARIRLRRAYGAQAQSFAATLGLGYLPRHGW